MTEYRIQKTEERIQKTEDRGERRSFDKANRHFSWYSFCLIIRVVYCISVLLEAFFWKRC